MQRKFYPSIIFLICLVAVIICTYWGIHQTFYQQDEWQELGLLRSGFITLNPFVNFSIWQLLAGQGRLLSDLMQSVLLVKFAFNLGPFMIVALTFHILNTILVYWTAIRISRSRIVSGVAAAFFGLNSVGSQAITWVGAVATLPATTLLLLSLLAYLQLLETDHKKWLYLCLPALFASLFFKEIGVFFIIFLPVLFYYWQKQTNLLNGLKANWSVMAYGILLILFRIGEMLTTTTKNGTLIAGNENFKLKVLWHIFLYPLTGFFQTFLPSRTIYHLAQGLAHLQYSYIVPTPLYDIVTQTLVTDLIATIGTTVLVLFLLWLNRRQNLVNRRLVLIAIAMTTLSFLPYAILDRGSSYMDSRYYYFASVGAGMVLGFIFLVLWRWRLAGKMIAVTALFLFLGHHVGITRSDLESQIRIADQRRNILTSIKQAKPQLGQTNIFYVTGDRDYDVPNNRVPFQQGVGYTLMVWYGNNQAIPSSFLSDRFLWDLGSEGYESLDGHGFGYFNQLTMLKRTVDDHRLNPNDVVGFYWDSHRRILRDITQQVRNQLH